MYKKVKILGLQRSGTNWLEQLVRANMDVEVYADPVEPFFKHALPNETDIPSKSGETIHTAVPLNYIRNHPEELFIVVFKPGELWVKSINKKKVDLQQKRPWLFNQQDRIVKLRALIFHEVYVNTWNELSLKNLLVVPYLEILSDYELFLEKLSLEFGIPLKRDKLVDIKKAPHSVRFTDRDKRKYLNYERSRNTGS